MNRISYLPMACLLLIGACTTDHPKDTNPTAQLPGDAHMGTLPHEKAPAERASRTSEPISDFNRNGIDDMIDIADGYSLDEDMNGIPDEAE